MTKKSYTKEFQDNAVRLATLGDKSVAGVARELGVPEWKLRGWIKKHESGSAKTSDMDELRRLHNENKRLKEENEILKKAAAYFAKNLQ
jgi:transposase